ncbi:MAG: hypothetical protein IV092_24730 [Burkholderiaceae bacterium]|nr:hypothetical protein [Burkholderiaceae bacterium]
MKPARPEPGPIPLSTSLRATARELQAAQPSEARSAAARLAMQAAFRQARPAASNTLQQRRWGGMLAWSGAATCAVVLLASTALLMNIPVGDADQAMPLIKSSAFVPLVAPERWSAYLEGGTAPAGAAWVVAAELPGDRLAALGLPYDPARAGERVRAELLLHPSGDVLAVRLLR